MIRVEPTHDDDKKIVEGLVTFMNKKLGKRIVFLDFVSVEKKQNKKYTVSFFAQEAEVLKLYSSSIKEYFKGEFELKPKSLLFLEDKDGEQSFNVNSRHEIFTTLKGSSVKDKGIEIDYCLKEDFFIEDENLTIEEKEEEWQIENWNKNILKKLPIRSATFSKISFKIGSRDFVSAIWIGYAEEQPYDKTVETINIQLYIENFLRSYSTNSIASGLISDVYQKSLKSSLAAVMARNQSHNIGSHVLSRFSQESDLQDVLREYARVQFIDYDYISKVSYNWKIAFNKEKNALLNKTISSDTFSHKWKTNRGFNIEDNKIKKLLAKYEIANSKMAVFNNYIKERQELLAEITSTVPLIQTNKSFKSEVLKGFTDNRILLDRISGIDDFKFTFKLDIEIDKESKDDISVAIANDVLGQQALYIIFENIIRNTAKHGSKVAKDIDDLKKVIFTIRVRESTLNPSYYQITVFDNIDAVSKNETIKCESKKKKEFCDKHYKDYIIEKSQCKCCGKEDITPECIYGKIPALTKLIIDQNALINRPILTEENELRTEALGLIEMEACAAYLRKLPVEDIEAIEYELKFSEKERGNLKKEIKKGKANLRILRAVNPHNENGLQAIKDADSEDEIQEIKNNLNYRENVLGYRFYLPKPEELLIIDVDNKLDNKHRKEAQRQGVLVLSPNSTDLNFKFEKEKVYPHEQLLVIGKPISYNSSYLPKRKLNVDFEHELIKKFSDGEYEALKERVLKEIVKQKCIDREVVINHKNFNEYYKDLISLDNSECYKKIEFSFDHHGSAYQIIESNHNCQISTHKEKDFISKNLEPKKKRRGRSSLELLNKVAVLKMLDSCINNVIILDERIQEKADTRYSLLNNEFRPDISYREVWQNTGCFIPHKVEDKIDLSSPNFNEIKINIIDWIESLRKGKLKTEVNKKKEVKELSGRIYKNIDTLIIHIGIIEKCLVVDKKNKECPEAKKNFISELFGNNTQNLNVILTSGRAPRKENLVPGFSFLTISIISDYLINNRFKYSLNELCNLARPKI